jgi:hypothetical protein
MAAGSNHISRGTWVPPILLLAAALLVVANGLNGTDDVFLRGPLL